VYELFGIIKATEMGVEMFNGIATANPPAKKYRKGAAQVPTFADIEDACTRVRFAMLTSIDL
jgi:hypothetical protein